MENGYKFGISYTFDMVSDDEFECTTYSKLFVLIKSFLDIDEDKCSGINFGKKDIHNILLKKEFIATAEFRDVYGKSIPYIIVKKVL